MFESLGLTGVRRLSPVTRSERFVSLSWNDSFNPEPELVRAWGRNRPHPALTVDYFGTRCAFVAGDLGGCSVESPGHTS